jgi:hypothetical protein
MERERERERESRDSCLWPQLPAFTSHVRFRSRGRLPEGHNLARAERLTDEVSCIRRPKDEAAIAVFS